MPPHRIEGLASRRRQGASDAEILASLRAPSHDGLQPAQPIPLTDDQARELLAEFDRVSG